MQGGTVVSLGEGRRDSLVSLIGFHGPQGTFQQRHHFSKGQICKRRGPSCQAEGGSGAHLTQGEASGVLAGTPKKMISSALESFGVVQLGSTYHTGEAHSPTSVQVTETFLMCGSLGLTYLAGSPLFMHSRNPTSGDLHGDSRSILNGGKRSLSLECRESQGYPILMI